MKSHVIGRCNGAINNITTVASTSDINELGFNDISGQAYFVRAWSYFSLVRLWGDIPLWLTLPDSDNLSKAKTSAKEVYAQIISDAQMATSLMNGAIGASLNPLGVTLKRSSTMVFTLLLFNCSR